MNKVQLWAGLDKLSVVFEPSDLPKNIVKLCQVNRHMFALTRSNIIYHSEVELNGDSTLVFTNTNISAIDIACNTKILYFVNENGHVFKSNPEDLAVREEVVLKEDAKCCSHGYKTAGHRVKVRAIAAEERSCLFITDNGQLWVSGDQPKLGLQDEVPHKVTFFEKRCVISVACGENFSIALAYKSGHCIPEKDGSDTDDDDNEDVFVSNCPQCISSPTTSDTCPLGLQVQQTSDEHSSTTSKENTAEDTSSGSTDGKYKSCDKMDAETNNNISDAEQEDSSSETTKKNEFFINTEAARQFLTRQLSWVSGYGGTSEELAECAEASLVRPSRIIKQNVSSVASMVYEGVKNVGDRGVTLFRHMSGGSEASDSGALAACESFEELSVEELVVAAPSNASSARCEESCWSSSCNTSDRGDDSEVGMTDRVTAMVRAGMRLLSTELWSWGDISHGQLGTGDTAKRNRPAIVSRLTGIGVCKIACGRDHALAVCLDGRVFAWGRNNYNQVSLNSQVDQSSPQQVGCERVREVSAGDCHSLFATHDDSLYYMGKNSNRGILKRDVSGVDCIFSSGQINGCLIKSSATSRCVSDLVAEQSFLEEMLLVNTALIKPLQKKGAAVQESNVYDVLCTRHSEILSFTCLGVASLRDYVEHADMKKLTVVQNVDEYVRVYKNYLNAVCDVIALSGFAHIARLVDIPPKMFTMFHEPSKRNKKSQESVVSCALLHPLKRLKCYKGMVQQHGEKLQDVLAKWEQLCEVQDQRYGEADCTRLFWESSGQVVELLRSPERRLVRESRSHPLSVLNSGRFFSSHWFVLFTDILVHINGGNQNVHPLTTLWVEVIPDNDSTQNALLLTMPEETLTVHTPSPQDKTEWLQSLQGAIKKSLQKLHAHVPPAVRNAKYTFTKNAVFKEAKYAGRWCSGKLQGSGKLEWPDGRLYVGQFLNNQMNGVGRLEIPNISTYEGQWKDGQQDGYGVLKYTNGDVYEGHFKDGVPHGHGIQKQGHFMSSAASVYIGEWMWGVRQGYGVMDDIATGEKYLGTWTNNMKQGSGLIVTLDGIYYEGIFSQDVLVGHGVMVFEDGTHYEGQFRAAGVFSGKGTLTFNSGDYLEGTLHGAWNEGVKVMGTFHKNTATPPSQLSTKPTSFGNLCVPEHLKWKSIFRQCYIQLGFPNGAANTSMEIQKVWENVAVVMNNSQQDKLHSKERSNDHLDTIPQFGRDNLDWCSYQEVRSYLSKAFESPHHPLGRLLAEVTAAYTATYGGVRVHPLLLSHAVSELHSLTARMYEVVRVLFPALPVQGQELQYEQESEVVSASALLHPALLPRVHSALFVLYALHNKDEDDAYWKRLLKWNRQPDISLMAFLGIDQKFWVTSQKSLVCESLEDQLFNDAVETLQQLKTTFSPLEKLLVIRSTFEQMTRAVQKELGSSYLWTMDDLFPVFHFVVVRSRILQLGSEIHFIEDFMEPYLQHGELGIMFTTLKACYYQILQEKNSVST